MSDAVATWRVESVRDGSLTRDVSDVVIVWRGEHYQSRFDRVLSPLEKECFLAGFVRRRRMQDGA